MLEWGLNWCVSSYCHQYLILHAAVIERGGQAVLLPAPPGSGKSTLCAGLVASGWRLLSDELCLIDPATLEIVPLARPISLKNASIEVISRFAPALRMGPRVSDTAKGTVAHLKLPTESVLRQADSARPRWIVLPRYVQGAPAALEPLSKGRAFMQLAESAFNYELHGTQGFDLLGLIVRSCDCYSFSYGDLRDAVRVFDGLV
jgi:HprK-related kinase A